MNAADSSGSKFQGSMLFSTQGKIDGTYFENVDFTVKANKCQFQCLREGNVQVVEIWNK